MDEQQNDDLEVTQDEETFEIEDDVEETTDSVEDEENSTQLHEELKKKEAEIAKLNRLLKKKDKAVEKGEEVPTNKEIERLRLEIKGYEDDQIDFIMSIGGVKALNNPAVKKVADAMKEEKSQLNAQATSKSQSKGSRTYSQAELQAMPLDKLESLIREGKIK
jgi:alcohol dehydrogenase class IV